MHLEYDVMLSWMWESYDMVDRRAMRDLLMIYGVGGHLLEEMEAFC